MNTKTEIKNIFYSTTITNGAEWVFSFHVQSLVLSSSSWNSSNNSIFFDFSIIEKSQNVSRMRGISFIKKVQSKTKVLIKIFDIILVSKAHSTRLDVFDLTARAIWQTVTTVQPRARTTNATWVRLRAPSPRAPWNTKTCYTRLLHRSTKLIQDVLVKKHYLS